MQNAKTRPLSSLFQANNSLILAIIILAILVAFGFYGYNVFRAFQSVTSQPGVIPVSESTLEEDYGLRAQLVAVTAAGGLVDLRLQVADAEKAEAFLRDSTNYPALRVGDDVVLRTSDTIALQDIQFEKDKSIFFLYPNSSNILKPGDAVRIVFGDIEVEPIEAK